MCAPGWPLEQRPWHPPAWHLVKGVLRGSVTVPVTSQQASPSRRAESRCHSAPRGTRWRPGTSEALRVMAEFQQCRGLCEEHLMQKYLGVLGTHMVSRFVLSGKGWTSLVVLVGARWARWHTRCRPSRGLAREKHRAWREASARHCFLKKKKSTSEKTKHESLI